MFTEGADQATNPYFDLSSFVRGSLSEVLLYHLFREYFDMCILLAKEDVASSSLVTRSL